MVRPPIAAGRFYSSDIDLLIKEIELHTKESLESPQAKKYRALGIVSPHAGFKYSGDVAGAVYSQIEIPETIILIGPNHTGLGERVSVMHEGTWNMPQGQIEVDNELADAICQTSLIAQQDCDAHRKEHSLENQLPFIQFYRKKFKIVPICMMRLGFDECEEIGCAIVKTLQKIGRSVLIVASSDMTHYETHESASKKDKKAIDQILKLDSKELYNVVNKNDISMCGINPTMVMLTCAIKMGAKKAVLARYMTSGEINGDMNHVVGYAGVIVK